MSRSLVKPKQKLNTITAFPSTTDAIESNLAAYWMALGKNSKGTIYESDSLSWEYSGGPFFNRVVDTHLDPHEADGEIAEIKKTFRDRHAAITWFVGPSTSPNDLGTRLRKQGFSRAEIWKGMSHDLQNLDRIDLPESLIDIRTVGDKTTRHDWIDVIARSYDLPRAARTSLLDSLAKQPEMDSVFWTHYLAYLDGVAVAAATLFVTDGIAGIYLVATRPDQRQKGLGSAVTAHVLRQAKAMGCRMAVLQSVEGAHGMYERLGFKSDCDIDVYRLPAPNPAWKRLAKMIMKSSRLRRAVKKNGKGPVPEPCEANFRTMVSSGQ